MLFKFFKIELKFIINIKLICDIHTMKDASR